MAERNDTDLGLLAADPDITSVSIRDRPDERNGRHNQERSQMRQMRRIVTGRTLVSIHVITDSLLCRYHQLIGIHMFTKPQCSRSTTPCQRPSLTTTVKINHHTVLSLTT